MNQGPEQPDKQAPPATLVDFVLRNLRVKTNVCTLQDFHDGGFRVDTRTVPDHNLIYISQGKAVWIIAGQEVPLRAHDLLIVPPGAPHRAESRAKRVLLASIHVDVTLPAGQNVLEMLMPPRVQAVAAGTPMRRYWRGVIDEWAARPRGDAYRRMPSWARLIVLEMLQDNAARGLLRYQRLDPLITQVLDELNRHIDTPWTLKQLAAWSGYSPQHLNRLFSAALGMTPLQYQAKRRMERAAALLAGGDLTVRAVAERLGFDDAYYFSRLFKQFFGQSPAEYRASAERGGQEP